MEQQEFVTRKELDDQISTLDLSGQSVCLHASLKSFGHVDGGAETIVDAFLEADCTVLVPTFTGLQLEVSPHPEQEFERNGWSTNRSASLPDRTETVFTPDLNLIDAPMGEISSAVLGRPERIRGNHPHNSFAAIGPGAVQLIDGQDWDDVYAPLRELTKQRGQILLAGVGLDRMTILYFAESLSGRRPFRRWATSSDGSAIAVSVGSCSDGFPNLENALGSLAVESAVGSSFWRLFPAAETVTASEALMRNDPGITHCGNPECLRCPHAIAGGPVL